MATDGRPRPRPRRAGFAPCLLLALLAAACGEREEPPPYGRQTITISEVPAPVLGAARRELPQIQFNEAWKNLDRTGKVTSYEVRGRAPNGKIREVRVSLTGQILEME